MTKLLNNLKSNKSGASAVEYALILALVGGLIVAAVVTLGGNVNTMFTNTNTALAPAVAAA